MTVLTRKPVLTKRDFVRRYAAGEFGNASPTWDTFEEYWKSCYAGLVHVRNRVAGAQTWYNVPRHKMRATWEKATSLFSSELLYISAMAPTDRTIIQGEVQRGLWGLDLTYTTVKKPMRDALAEHTEHAQGIVANYLLQSNLCVRSYAWLEFLLEAYPNHVVEFSTYEVEWGTVPGYNTVFWEVRKY